MSVYFAQVKGYVKIGYSCNPVKRMSALLRNGIKVPADVSREDRINLLGWLPGDRYVEADTQARFRHLHVGGEWFWDEPEIDAYLTSHPRGFRYGLDPDDVSVLIREFPHLTRAQILDVASPILEQSRADFHEANCSRLCLCRDLLGMAGRSRELLTEERARWRAIRPTTTPEMRVA